MRSGQSLAWTERLSLDPAQAAKVFDGPGARSDFDLNPAWRRADGASSLRPAAVLVGLIDRAPGGQGDPQVIFTRRADHLSKHAGQISFPGGRIDRTDRDPLSAALREAEEEIGLDPKWVRPLGYLDTYETGTGFRILPVVAWIDGRAQFAAHPGEVAEIFEVPLSFLMDPRNHQRITRPFGGKERTGYVLTFKEYQIWGATAGMLVNFYDTAFRADAPLAVS